MILYDTYVYIYIYMFTSSNGGNTWDLRSDLHSLCKSFEFEVAKQVLAPTRQSVWRAALQFSFSIVRPSQTKQRQGVDSGKKSREEQRNLFL